MQAIFLADEEKVKAFIETVSKPRLTKYLNATGGSESKALALYHWNSLLSQALYLPLQNWEVSLRNKINNFLRYKYGTSKWYDSDRALRNFNRNDRSRVEDTIKRLTREMAPAIPSSDQVVADLSAGFWVSQLGKDYASHYTWKSNIRFRVFTHNQVITRETADDACTGLLALRNRVAHHEPIFHMPLQDLRQDIDLMLGGLSPTMAEYMTSTCSFASIWDSRPT